MFILKNSSRTLWRTLKGYISLLNYKMEYYCQPSFQNSPEPSELPMPSLKLIIGIKQN